MNIEYTSFDKTLADSSLYYNVNRELSEKLVEKIKVIQQVFAQRFGDSVFIPTRQELHSTLMLWSHTEFAQNETLEERENYLQTIYPSYSASLKNALSMHAPFDVHFHTLKLTSKTITLIGTDNGEYEAIRNAWWNGITPTDKTPPLPSIIHSTILVFKAPVEREVVLQTLKEHSIDHVERVSDFRLVRETKMRAQEFEEIERYVL